MRKIKWQSTAICTTNKRCAWRSFPSWAADAGVFKIRCEPQIRTYWGRRIDEKKLIGWYCILDFMGRPIVVTKTRKLERLAKEDGHILLEQHLAGFGLIVVEDLKRDGLLNEVLSEVGIEI